MDILWLRPNKPENVSVGRHRIANILESRGHSVEVRNTTPVDFIRLLSRSPDVIVGTTRLGAFVGAWHKLVRGTPLVVDHIDPISQMRRTHGRFITKAVDYMERFAFRISDQALVVYEEEYDRVARYASNVTKTSLGVDYDRFANPSTEVITEARETLQGHVTSGRPILIYVGGLEPEYHIRELVAVMDHLDEWELVLLGDGSEREFVEDASEKRDTVNYLGTVPYELVPGFLHEADVGISLIDDPNTLKVLEYGAAGLPVVQLEGTARERFGERVSYCSATAEDIASVVRNVACSSDRTISRFASQYRWETIAKAYERVLTQAIESKLE